MVFMKILPQFLTFILMAVTISCSTVYDVQYNYETTTDFARFKTFAWFPKAEKAESNQRIVQRIQDAVQAELSAKGFRMTSDNPDFLIAIHLGMTDKVRVTDLGYGYGPYGRSWGSDGLDIYQYREGALVLNFVDFKAKHLFWRGWAKSVVGASSPGERERKIKEAAAKILQNFPPPPLK